MPKIKYNKRKLNSSGRHEIVEPTVSSTTKLASTSKRKLPEYPCPVCDGKLNYLSSLRTEAYCPSCNLEITNKQGNISIWAITASGDRWCVKQENILMTQNGMVIKEGNTKYAYNT